MYLFSNQFEHSNSFFPTNLVHQVHLFIHAKALLTDCSQTHTNTLLDASDVNNPLYLLILKLRHKLFHLSINTF